MKKHEKCGSTRDACTQKAAVTGTHSFRFQVFFLTACGIVSRCRSRTLHTHHVLGAVGVCVDVGSCVVVERGREGAQLDKRSCLSHGPRVFHPILDCQGPRLFFFEVKS